MTIIKRLKELEQAAREVSDSDWSNLEEFLDTNESHVFAYALQDAWPKLLAFVEAYDNWLDLYMQDAREDLEDDGSLEAAVERLDQTRKALDEV